MDFEGVYREYYAPVWRFLRHLGIPERDAPDVTHNVFLVAYRKLRDFEQRSTVRTWLYGIALRLARDFRKSAWVRLEVSSTDLPDAEPASDSASCEHDGLLDLAQRLLAALPPEQREVFVLHELEQMTGAEIASLTGRPLGTVRSRLRRARAFFRHQLAGAEPAHSRRTCARREGLRA